MTWLRGVGLLLAGSIVIATGLRLAVAGRPFGVVLQTVHKLVALGVVIYIGVAVYWSMRVTSLNASTLALAVVALLLAVAALASGGIVSASESVPSWVLWTHRIGSWLSIATLGAVAFVVLALT